MIRITYIMLFTLVLPLFTKAQINHVPNGDFEYYTNCPSNHGQVSLCTGWSSVLFTPDFFHACNTNYIPNNFFGYQQPASGNGYIGMVAYHTTISSSREMIGRSIIPLTKGRKYKVSLSVSLGNNCQYAANNIGVFFYDSLGPLNSSNWQSIQPQISFRNRGVISDTADWVRLEGTFIADSAYDNIIIGGFYPALNMQTSFLYNGNYPYAYYYLDSIVVSPQNTFYIDSTSETTLCVSDTFLVKVTCDTNYNINNIFTVQLSDSNGNFNAPLNIGNIHHNNDTMIVCIIPSQLPTSQHYQIRAISSSNVDTTPVYSKRLSIGNINNVTINTLSNSPLCEGDTLRLSSSIDSLLTSVSWSGPNNYSSFNDTVTIPSITIHIGGEYYLTSKLYGCERKDTVTVIVKPLPNKPIATGNTPICEYDSLILTSNSTTSGISYQWTGPNGFTSTTNDTSIGNASIANGGSYIITATKDGCNSYDTVFVIVNNIPDTVSISYTSPCSGDTLKIFTDTLPNVSYSWKGPNNFAANTQNIFIPNSIVNNSGWYIMTVSNTNCSYKDSVNVTVWQTPAIPTITYTTPICVGEALSLSALGNNTSTYNWSGANNYSTTGQSVTRSNIQLADSGIYTVTASLNGCTASASTNISINPTPFANIYVTPNDSICTGEVVSFTALPSNAGANPQYAWFINAQQQSFTGQQFYPTGLGNNDVVYCEMTDNVKCSSPYTDQSNTIRMTVLPWLAPSVSITSNPSGLLLPWQYVTFTAHPVNAGTSPQYQWKRNGQDIVGATGSTWSANNLNDNDSISVELVSDYKCPQPVEAMSNGIVVSVAVGVNNVRSENNITLIPNPNNGQFALKGNIGTNGTAQISIINTLGQIVHQHKTFIKDQTINERIDLQDVANGLYLLRLDINGQRINIKFNVQ